VLSIVELFYFLTVFAFGLIAKMRKIDDEVVGHRAQPSSGHHAEPTSLDHSLLNKILYQQKIQQDEIKRLRRELRELRPSSDNHAFGANANDNHGNNELSHAIRSLDIYFK
jgi:hypothetical protein